jgi:hypothetical protein
MNPSSSGWSWKARPQRVVDGETLAAALEIDHEADVVRPHVRLQRLAFPSPHVDLVEPVAEQRSYAVGGREDPYGSGSWSARTKATVSATLRRR